MVALPIPETFDNSDADLILPTLLRYSTIAFAFASPMPLNDCNVFSSAVLMFTFEDEATFVATLFFALVAAVFAEVIFSAADAFTEVAFSAADAFTADIFSVAPVFTADILSVADIFIDATLSVAEVFAAFNVSFAVAALLLNAEVADDLALETCEVTASFAASFTVENGFVVSANEVAETAIATPNAKRDFKDFIEVSL